MVFKEQQRFDQWWFRALMVVVAVVMIGQLFLVYPKLNQNNNTLWLYFGITAISLIVIVLMVFYLKLETKIDSEGVHYAFWPINFKSRLIPWEKIKDCYVRKYNPILEYGGWGYRIKLGTKSRALNVKGNIGIQIVFKEGKKFLLGTQKEEEAKKVLEAYKHKLTAL